ncbi:hypothetical protein GCM10022295_90600 [Streptomyces osmaniensis]|uniref:Uncharacterized protein n=1 Tax=Streptomyces osmaniensis TaxID=593134 RepID=A0ABP6Z5K6_9ACTN
MPGWTAYAAHRALGSIPDPLTGPRRTPTWTLAGSGPPYDIRPDCGVTVDSLDNLRSTHARVAALCRYRGSDDPEVVAARAELARCVEETRTIRDLAGKFPAALRAQLLDVTERASVRV